MIIETFPSELKQLLKNNKTTFKNRRITSDYSFEKNGINNQTNKKLNIALILNISDLTIFENFYINIINNGNNPFYGSFFSGYIETSDLIYKIIGGYSSKHISKEIYEINFLVEEY